MRSLLLVISFFSCCVAQEEEVLYRSHVSGLILKAFTGAQARSFSKEIADLRITLFAEYPYLYAGNQAHEQEYLETYFKSQTARILLLFDKARIVGFSNSLLLSEETREVQHDFRAKGFNLSDYLYIGEGMLLPEYRRQNIIKIAGAFTYHQARARQCGSNHLLFMTVDRPEDHPRKPVGYQSLEPIWTHYGFKQMEDMKVALTWTQIDTGRDEANTLSLWSKNLIAE